MCRQAITKRCDVWVVSFPQEHQILSRGQGRCEPLGKGSLRKGWFRKGPFGRESSDRQSPDRQSPGGGSERLTTRIPRQGDDLGLASGKINDRRFEAGPVNYQIGIADGLDPSQAEKPGIADTNIDNPYLATGLTIRIGDHRLETPVGGSGITDQNMRRRRALDNAVLKSASPGRRESPQPRPAAVEIGCQLAETGRQHGFDSRPYPLTEDRCRATRGNGDKDR